MKKRNLTKKDKREIIEKWQQEFPYMGIYKETVLAYVMEPFVIGVFLEIKSDKTCYEPMIFIDTLGYVNDFDSLPNALLLTYEVPFETISNISKPDKYIRIANQLKEKCVIPLGEDLTAERLFCLLEFEYKKRTIDDEKKSIIYLILTLALWSEKIELIDKANEILNEFKIKLSEDARLSDRIFCDCSSEKNSLVLREIVNNNKIKLNLYSLPSRKIVL